MKSILQRFMIGAATASLAVGTTISAAAAPAFHRSIPAEVLVLRCTETVYTGISGTLKFVGRGGESASGNSQFGGTGSLKDVVVTDGTHSYRAIGAKTALPSRC